MRCVKAMGIIMAWLVRYGRMHMAESLDGSLIRP